MESNMFVYLAGLPSADDKKLQDQLIQHLEKPLKQRGDTLWHYGCVQAGENKTSEINSFIDKADLILLPVTPNFISNEEFKREETLAMQKLDEHRTQVIPIILKHVIWKGESYGKLQALPTHPDVVTSWGDQDKAFAHITEEIIKIIEKKLGKQKKPAEQSTMQRQNREPIPLDRSKEPSQKTFLPITPKGEPRNTPPTSSRREIRWLTLLVGVLGVIILGSVLVYFTSSYREPSGNNPNQTPPATSISQPTLSYPRLASAYQGSVNSITFQTSATLALTSIVQNQQVISGDIVIGSELVGSGSFTGTITSNGSVSFTDIPTDGSRTIIIFSGSLQTDGSLDGTYTNLGESNQQGTWQTMPS